LYISFETRHKSVCHSQTEVQWLFVFMRSNLSKSSPDGPEARTVEGLLQQFEQLPEEDKGVFIEALIKREKIQHIMNLVSKCAKSRIDRLQDS
jgi:hypothetical protein